MSKGDDDEWQAYEEKQATARGVSKAAETSWRGMREKLCGGHTAAAVAPSGGLPPRVAAGPGIASGSGSGGVPPARPPSGGLPPWSGQQWRLAPWTGVVIRLGSGGLPPAQSPRQWRRAPCLPGVPREALVQAPQGRRAVVRGGFANNDGPQLRSCPRNAAERTRDSFLC